MRLILFLIGLIALLGVVHVFAQDDEFDDTDYVTCGSLIKLEHVTSNARLHSHKVNYASGSGQQSVTGIKSFDDPNSYWTVREAYGKPQCVQGTPVAKGSRIRLLHVSTGKFLHSHLHQSPITRQQEVSCFGSDAPGAGDSGDDWIISMKESFWVQSSKVRFQHVDTQAYLHCTPSAEFPQPIQGQLEVAGRTRRSADNLWVAAEGIYFPKRNDG